MSGTPGRRSPLVVCNVKHEIILCWYDYLKYLFLAFAPAYLSGFGGLPYLGSSVPRTQRVSTDTVLINVIYQEYPCGWWKQHYPKLLST